MLQVFLFFSALSLLVDSANLPSQTEPKVTLQLRIRCPNPLSAALDEIGAHRFRNTAVHTQRLLIWMWNADSSPEA